MKRAVVVGINDYTLLDPSGNSNLSCSVADANSIYELLVSSFGFDDSASVKLTDQAASRDQIVSALRDLVSKSQPGDVACFYYAGHGSSIPGAPDPVTCNRYYQAIIPASGVPFSDRDLFDVGSLLQPSVVNFTVILDSCHSGGMSREVNSQFNCRSLVFSADQVSQMVNSLRTLVPCGLTFDPSSDGCAGNVSSASATGGHLSIVEDPDKIFIDLAKTTLVAGCTFAELSYEAGGHGLLTKAFLDIVNASDFQISYGDLLDQLRAHVKNDFESEILPGVLGEEQSKQQCILPHSQVPQLRGQRNRIGQGFLRALAIRVIA